jgi:hypothetical protein
MKKTNRIRVSGTQSHTLLSTLCAIALVTATALCFAACGDKSGSDGEIIDNNNGTTGGIIGNNIVSGVQVRYADSYGKGKDAAGARAQTDFSYNYDKPLSYYLNGSPSAKINDGKLTIVLGTPKPEYMENAAEYFDYGDLTVTPNTANILELGLYSPPPSPYYSLHCEKDDNNWTYLVYADRDVTIRGNGTYDDGTETEENWNVSLKKGWNYLLESYSEKTYTETYTYTATTTLPGGYYWIVR